MFNHQKRLDQKLLQAIIRENVADVRISLRRGANPNAVWTPSLLDHLLWPLYWRNIPLVRHLSVSTVKKPAILIPYLWLKIKEPQRGIPENTVLVRLLLEHGADPNTDDLHSGGAGFTVLRHAAINDHYATAKLLLEYGADPNRIFGQDLDRNAGAVLGVAGEDLVPLLLEYGADPNMLNAYQLTPLMRFDRLENLQLLLDFGANIEGRSGNGEHTALMWAAFSGKAEKIRFLLEHGAKASVRGRLFDSTQSALDIYKDYCNRKGDWVPLDEKRETIRLLTEAMYEEQEAVSIQ